MFPRTSYTLTVDERELSLILKGLAILGDVPHVSRKAAEKTAALRLNAVLVGSAQAHIRDMLQKADAKAERAQAFLAAAQAEAGAAEPQPVAAEVES